MGYTASSSTLDHLVELIAQERLDWDPGLVRIVLQSHVALVDGTDLAIAALRLAQNRDVHTPKAIGWRGAHWRDLTTMPPEVKAGPRCGVCHKREPECLLQRPGKDDDHDFEPVEVTR